MAEKNSLWRNIREKGEQNRRTGATPKKPTTEMIRQERKIKAKKAEGGPIGDDELYNMQRAVELGYTPDETGHWPSVDSETGMFLKSKEHPTAWMEYLYGHTLNPELNRTTNVVVNPKGYFGNNQLQYIPKEQKATGGYYPTQGPGKALFKGYKSGGPVKKPKPRYLTPEQLGAIQVMEPSTTIVDTVKPTVKKYVGYLPGKKRSSSNVKDAANKIDSVQSTYNMYNQQEPFLKNWYSHPETQKRLKENLSYSMDFPNESLKALTKDAIQRLEKTPVFSREAIKNEGVSQNDIEYNNNVQGWKSAVHDGYNPYLSDYDPNTKSSNAGLFSPRSGQVIVDTFDDTGTIAHEGVHVAKYWQKFMEDVIKWKYMDKKNSNARFEERYGDIKSNPNRYQNWISDEPYYDSDGMYPRIMDIRKELNLKPGQPVNKSILENESIKNPLHDLRHYYDDDTIIKMLNELASNKTQATSNNIEPQYAANGGYTNPYNMYQKDPYLNYAQGGYYATGSRVTEDNEDGKNVVLKPRSVYDSKTGETRNFQVSADNKTIIDASDPTQTINHFLPEVEIGEEAPAWLKSQRKNPELYSGSGRADYVPVEAILLPGSLPFKATSRLGRAALFAAEMQNPGFGVGNLLKGSLKSSLGQTKDQLSKAVKGTSSLFKEIKGELLQGKANKKSIEEGNQWLENWINHPATQAKIDKDIDNYVSVLKKNELQNLENNFGSLKISDPAAYSSLEDDILNNPDYLAELIRGQSKNFKPNSKEYSLFKQVDENLQQYFNPKGNYNLDPIHQGNWGVSYQHGISPLNRQSVQSGVMDPFERYGSWISRSRRMPQYQRVGTTIHEGTHDWVSDEAFKKIGIRNSVLRNMNPEIKKDFLEWESLRNQGIDPETVMGAERAYQAYLADPTEMHARIMELRKQLQLTPDYKMDLNAAKNIINFIEDEKSFITPKILNVVDKDPKKFAELFNNFWVAAPVAGGALYQLEQNNKPKQQAKGGYTMKNNNQSWRNYLQYAIGGKEGIQEQAQVEGEDPFKSPLNQGATVGKPAQEWLTNWVQNPEFSARMNKLFPDKSSKLEKKVYGAKDARRRTIENNIETIDDNIPRLVKNINKSSFLFNQDRGINQDLVDSYKNTLNKADRAYLEEELLKNPQGFTDTNDNIIINNPNGYSPESIAVHELIHKNRFKTDQGYERLSDMMTSKFKKPLQEKIDEFYGKTELYPFIMQMRFDNKFEPGEEITPERIKQIRESGPKNHLFNYYDDDQISNYLNKLASNTVQPNTQGPYTQITAQGGYINNTRQYGVGGINSAGSVGQVADASSIDQGAAMGAVSKAAGAIPGYGQAIQAGMAINNTLSDIGSSIVMSQTPGRYKDFMAQEQERGKWMNSINPIAGMIYRGIGSKGRLEDYKQEARKEEEALGTAQFKANNPIEQISLNSPTAAYGGYMTNNSLNLHNTMRNKKFAQGGTFDQYGINMIPESAGLHHQSAYGGVPIGPDALAEGGEIKMDTGDGGQYIVSDQVDGAGTQRDFTFSKGGKYKELNRTLADGMKQDLNKFTFGSLATSDRVKGDLRRPNDSYAQSTIEQIKQKWQQKTEYARQRSQQEQAIAQAEEQKRMAEEEYIAAYGGRINPKKYPGLNMPGSYAKGGIHINPENKGKFTASAKAAGHSVQEHASAVLNNPNATPLQKKRANFARNAAKWKHDDGGYVYNPMTQPMLATGGPVYGDPASPYTYKDGGSTKYPIYVKNNMPKPQISNNQVMDYLADMNERGMLEPGRQFTPKWESVNDVDGTEKMIDLTKDLNSTDLERVRSLYNFKQKNRNAFGFARGGMYGDPYYRGGQIDYTNDMYSSYAGGGPMVGNAPQAFSGYAAQNRGGMLMNYADGGMMPSPEQQMMQEQQMQQASQEQQGGQEQMMQMVQQVMQALMQGANPEEIMQQLVQSGMPPEQAQQIIQMAMQEAQGQQQQQPMQGQEQMMPQQGMMANGGKMRYDGGGFGTSNLYPTAPGMGVNPMYPTPTGYSPQDDLRFWADETEYPTVGTAVTPNGMKMNFKNAQQMGNQITTILQNQNSNNPNNLNQNKDEPWSEEPWYSKASRYSQAIPGIAATITGLRNKKRRLDPSLMAAQRVSYEPERIVDREESRNALNAGLRQMRTMGATPGSIMGNTRDAVLSSNKGLAGRIAESVMREANTNAQFGQQADMTNTAARNQFKQINEGMFQNAQTQALAGLQDTTSKLASTAQEERKQYLQEWIARNRLKTRNYSTADSGEDVYRNNTDGYLYDSNGNRVNQ